MNIRITLLNITSEVLIPCNGLRLVLCCVPVSCLGCNLIKMCEECNLRPSDLFYSLAANMAGTECDPAISTHTQSLGAGAKLGL